MITKVQFSIFSFFRRLFDLLLQIRVNKSEIRSNEILLVRVDNIGDFILWLPYANRLCNHFSEFNGQILVCNQSCVELAEAIGIFDRVIGIDPKKLTENLWYRLRILRMISFLNISVAIQPTFSRDFLTGDSIIRATRAKTKIGSIGDFSNINPLKKKISDSWYSVLVPVTDSPIMELYRNVEFLHNLGVIGVYPELPTVPVLLELPPEKRLNSNYFIIFPGASALFRQWPIEFYAALAFKIFQNYKLIPVICGGLAEIELCQKVQNITKVINSINFVGNTSLPELFEIIRSAKLLISNETSAIHIAAAVETPSVCILGGGHYGRFLPYPDELKGSKPIPVFNKMDCFGCNWECCLSEDLTRPFPCVEGINVSQVLSAVEEALKK